MSPARASGSFISTAWARHSSARSRKRRIFSFSLLASVLIGVNYARYAGHVHWLSRAMTDRAGKLEAGAEAVRRAMGPPPPRGHPPPFPFRPPLVRLAKLRYFPRPPP